MNYSHEEMKMVVVVWNDAYRDMDDYSMEDAYEFETIHVEELGWLVTEDEEKVIIARARLKDGIRDPIAIPKGMVLSIVPVYPDGLSGTMIKVNGDAILEAQD